MLDGLRRVCSVGVAVNMFDDAHVANLCVHSARLAGLQCQLRLCVGLSVQTDIEMAVLRTWLDLGHICELSTQQVCLTTDWCSFVQAPLI